MDRYVIEVLIGRHDGDTPTYVVDRLRAGDKQSSNAQLARVLPYEGAGHVRRRRIRGQSVEPVTDLF